TARNSKPIEVIGTYDPIPKPPPLGEEGKPVKDIKLDTARAKYWLGVGAQPSEPMWRLLSMIGLLEPKYHIQKMQQMGAEQRAARREEGMDAVEGR
ncbi:MAG: 37S ribosomal protein S16, mitochondrial, partial [Alectoria fallacina]